MANIVNHHECETASCRLPTAVDVEGVSAALAIAMRESVLATSVSVTSEGKETQANRKQETGNTRREVELPAWTAVYVCSITQRKNGVRIQ